MRTPARPEAPAAPAWTATLRDLLRARLGHELPEARLRDEIAAFAVSRAHALGLKDAGAWVDLAGGPGGQEEWRRLVRAATVGETYFFRHPEQIEALTAFAAALAAKQGRRLAVWCAGCATGEEAWSLAVRFAEAGVAADVLATDVNDESLARARAAGGYSERSAARMPAPLRARWLVRTPDGWRLPAAATLPVSFALHNLAYDPPPNSGAPGGGFDLVVCRNVLLYFPLDLVADVIARAVERLTPEGGLWLGPADPVPTTLLLAHRDVWEGERFLRRNPPRTARAPQPSVAAVPARVRTAPLRPEPDPGALLAQGFVATAQEAFEQRLVDGPDPAQARVALAGIALSRHEFHVALEHLEAARRASPRPPGCEYLRGLTLLRLGRPEEAAEAFAEALVADPDDWAASLQLALHHHATGRRLREELMLEHAALRLEEDPVRVPDHGPAGSLVDSVHRDPQAALRVVRERLKSSSGAGRTGPA